MQKIKINVVIIDSWQVYVYTIVNKRYQYIHQRMTYVLPFHILIYFY